MTSQQDEIAAVVSTSPQASAQAILTGITLAVQALQEAAEALEMAGTTFRDHEDPAWSGEGVLDLAGALRLLRKNAYYEAESWSRTLRARTPDPVENDGPVVSGDGSTS
jgi:hypothetical protein